MTMDAIAIEIEELTPEQAAAIWAEQKKRPANYLEFVVYLRAKSIGDSFDVKIKGDTDEAREAHVKAVKRWFGEAGKERVRFDTVDGKTVETPEPVVLRWKETAHKETRKVVDPTTKKSGDVEVKVIDRLHGKLVDASDAPQRGRGSDSSEQVDELVASTQHAADAKKVTLPDGREATKTRSGHWRAPKLQQAALPDSGDSTSNGANSSAATAESTNGAAKNEKVAATA